jgi:hypothetical protein
MISIFIFPSESAACKEMGGLGGLTRFGLRSAFRGFWGYGVGRHCMPALRVRASCQHPPLSVALSHEGSDRGIFGAQVRRGQPAFVRCLLSRQGCDTAMGNRDKPQVISRQMNRKLGDEPGDRRTREQMGRFLVFLGQGPSFQRMSRLGRVGSWRVEDADGRAHGLSPDFAPATPLRCPRHE